MFKMTLLSLALLAGTTSLSNAAPVHLPGVGPGIGPDSAVVQVGEGCGANRWRDRNGNCHWFGGPGGTNRGTAYECPPGLIIGPGGQRCWPIR